MMFIMEPSAVIFDLYIQIFQPCFKPLILNAHPAHILPSLTCATLAQDMHTQSGAYVCHESHQANSYLLPSRQGPV